VKESENIFVDPYLDPDVLKI